jgi:hypothetical protein
MYEMQQALDLTKSLFLEISRRAQQQNSAGEKINFDILDYALSIQ